MMSSFYLCPDEEALAHWYRTFSLWEEIFMETGSHYNTVTIQISILAKLHNLSIIKNESDFSSYRWLIPHLHPSILRLSRIISKLHQKLIFYCSLFSNCFTFFRLPSHPHSFLDPWIQTRYPSIFRHFILLYPNSPNWFICFSASLNLTSFFIDF